MARYDWPAGPRSEDDQLGRAGHLARFRPQVDLTVLAQPLPRPKARGARAVPHNLPVGPQNLWFPLGPSVMLNGQATGTPNVAGRIRDLQVEPAAGQRVYAASASGGVWFSADRG